MYSASATVGSETRNDVALCAVVLFSLGAVDEKLALRTFVSPGHSPRKVGNSHGYTLFRPHLSNVQSLTSPDSDPTTLNDDQ